MSPRSRLLAEDLWENTPKGLESGGQSTLSLGGLPSALGHEMGSLSFSFQRALEISLCPDNRWGSCTVDPCPHGKRHVPCRMGASCTIRRPSSSTEGECYYGHPAGADPEVGIAAATRDHIEQSKAR
jgi:hypothetical protein